MPSHSIVTRTCLAASALLLASVAPSVNLHAQPLPQAALESQWQRLETASWIEEGPAHAPHLLYAFVDPNCPYCHQLWLAMQLRYSRDKVAVRYILIGIITKTSPGKAAAILSAANPDQALRQNELDWNRNPVAGKGGGTVPVTHFDFAMLMKLTQNQKLADLFGIMGTPGLVWRDRTGQVHVLESLPQPEQLSQIIASASAD